MNTNVTRVLALNLSSLVFPVGLSGSYYTYAAYNPFPVAHTSITLPSTYRISPEEILLINNF